MLPMPCSPTIVGDNSTTDVEQFPQHGPEDTVADAWQPIASDALRIALQEQGYYFVDGRRLWLLDLC
jgi:hypothetical protein